MAEPHSRRLWLKWQGYLSAVLIIAIGALAAYLSLRYERVYDWTAARRHTIAEASRAVLAGLDKPVHVSAYMAKSSPLREQARFLVERYQRVKPDVSLEFVDPDRDPERTRQAGIRFDGEMIVRYGERELHVDGVNEEALTNALQSLARGGERWVAFAQGHGERDPQGQANHDLGQFGAQLSNRGFKVQPLMLAETAAVPDNTALLVIASPQSDWLAAETGVVRDYLERGGNLLVLTEPGRQRGLDPLLEELGIGVQAGTIVDPTSQKLGLDNAALALIARYPDHPATRGFNVLTLFPYAAGLRALPADGWQHAPLLETAAGAWAETGEMNGNVGFDAATDTQGPLAVGIALTREKPGASGPAGQRVAVIGDGDFLSNTYLGNSGNLDLGLRLFTWLTGDDELVAIPARTAPDATLELSRPATLAIGFGFLFVLPLLLLGAGARIWYGAAPPMKARTVLNALLALVAAALLWLALKQPGGPGSADEQPLLTALAKDSVSRIELRHPRSAPMVLERSEAGWRMTQPYAIGADADRINLLLDFLGARSLTRFPVVDGELARYGLAEPNSILILNDQRFEFGIQHPLAPNRYVRSGDTVHLVTDIINQHLNSGVESYIDPRLLDEDFGIASITVPGLTVEQRDGRLTASTGSESADTVARFVEEWRHARAMEVRAMTEGDRNRGTTETARIIAGDGDVIEFAVLAREPTLRLGRMDLGIVYEFPAETAAQLMALGPAAAATPR